MTIEVIGVLGLLNELDIEKPDEMHSKLLREPKDLAANPLSICFNLSVTQD